MKGLLILWILGLSQLALASAWADGTGDSSERRTKLAGRHCTRPCVPPCATPVTVNCQQAPASLTATPTALSATPVEIKDSSAKTSKNSGDVWTHVVDKFPEVLWWLLAVIAVFYYGRRWPIKLLRGLKKFKAGSVEFEFSAERGREAEADFHESFDSFVKLAKKEYDRQVKSLQLSELLRTAVEAVLARKPKIQDGGAYRATVYVPDIVFERFLYQLLDYHPEPGGRGRRFSERYGIIGRCWRIKESTGEANAVRVGVAKNAVDTLTRYWGMTKAEAENTRRTRPSVLCTLLFAPDETRVPVGFIFMDSEHKEVFGDDAEKATQFAKLMEKDDAVRALAKAVGKAMEDLRVGAAHIELT